MSTEVAHPKAQNSGLYEVETAKDIELLKQAPILSGVCKEGSKEKVHHIRELHLTRERLLKFWSLASRHRVLMWKDLSNDFDTFTSAFLKQEKDGTISANGLIYVIDDFIGYIYVTKISAHDCEVHFAFFDRRMSGRESLGRAFIDYLFETFNFHRISAVVATYANKRLYDYLVNVGFRHEGRRAEALWFNGEFWDEKLYSVINPSHIKDKERKE